jgi:hypothetical protein
LFEQLPERNYEKDNTGCQRQRGGGDLPVREQCSAHEAAGDRRNRGNNEGPQGNPPHYLIVDSPGAVYEGAKYLERTEHHEHECEDLGQADHV